MDLELVSFVFLRFTNHTQNLKFLFISFRDNLSYNRATSRLEVVRQRFPIEVQNLPTPLSSAVDTNYPLQDIRSRDCQTW